jgi:hypothetical protein
MTILGISEGALADRWGEHVKNALSGYRHFDVGASWNSYELIVSFPANSNPFLTVFIPKL